MAPFLAILTIALACVGANPLTSVDLKRCGACPHDLTALASCVTGRTDGRGVGVEGEAVHSRRARPVAALPGE
jgi:hypothetical protein